jgi:hypothetical protein
MTFGSIETINPCGADADKNACWAAAGAVLSCAYVKSSNIAVRMTLQLMLFGFFIPDPFVIGDCSWVRWLKMATNWLAHQFDRCVKDVFTSAPRRRDDRLRRSVGFRIPLRAETIGHFTVN